MRCIASLHITIFINAPEQLHHPSTDNRQDGNTAQPAQPNAVPEAIPGKIALPMNYCLLRTPYQTIKSRRLEE
jgi:hypothetical protein